MNIDKKERGRGMKRKIEIVCQGEERKCRVEVTLEFENLTNWEATNELLRDKLRIAVEALKYSSKDDPVAVTQDGQLDVESANEWKKFRAQEALAQIEGVK